MTRNVLVTGGFGYLGGRIATAIAGQGSIDVVRLTSRRPRPAPPWLPGAETAVLDLSNQATLLAALSGVDSVIHLAAANEIQCAADSLDALRVNTFGTIRLLEAAILAGVQRFIYFSTAHIYGSPLLGEITEQTLPRPFHPYAITHRAAEDFVLAAHNKSRIIGTVIRLSNAVGAPTHLNIDRWTLVANDLCRQAVQTRKLTLLSDGLQERDFIPIYDVERAVCHFLNLTRIESTDGLFNLGGESTLCIYEMAMKIAQRCKLNLGFEPSIERPGTPRAISAEKSLQYSIQKLKDTGFSLGGSLDSEIDQMLRLCEGEWSFPIV
jgi:UDP-glucose 4-epimerase